MHAYIKIQMYILVKGKFNFVGSDLLRVATIYLLFMMIFETNTL